MLGMLVACLEQETTDVLGTLYHRLALHNHQSGQFFTPYPLCQVMAKMLVHNAKLLEERQEFIRAHEPCVGSGAMVIALTQALREEGINYQHKLHVTAIDIDIVAVSMAYVQCTLLHIPAQICPRRHTRRRGLQRLAHVGACHRMLGRKARPRSPATVRSCASSTTYPSSAHN